MSLGQQVIDGQMDLLDAITTDPTHDEDAARVRAAIVAEAGAHDGLIDPNRVRERLTFHGAITVNPQVLSSTYSTLARSRVIVAAGYTRNLDRRGKNYGKPARLWELANTETAA